ncbi:MAG: chromosome partitioning protein ParB [Pseudomonadota bacterium]
MSGGAFTIDLGGLRSRAKETEAEATRKADAAGESHGFVAREPRGRPGRKPSPRTGQVHAKVLPHVSAEIADEARRRGVTQGVLIEEAWALYLARG